jgi:hypothetical protein
MLSAGQADMRRELAAAETGAKEARAAQDEASRRAAAAEERAGAAEARAAQEEERAGACAGAWACGPLMATSSLSPLS